MKPTNPINSRSGFTLLELVIVVGIVAILGTVSVIVLNPAEMFKQTRDTNRISDLQSVNNALLYYQAAGGTAFGSHNVIYVSLPDTSSTCANLALPTPPVSWSYACQTAANYRNVNGTGWIPVDFTTAQGIVGTLFSTLPIDPVNTLSGDYYYTYIFGTWTMSASLESVKYLAANATNDGGCIVTRFEVGNDLALNCNVQTGGGLSAVKTLTAFSFASPSATGVVTEGSHTVAITVPYGTNVTALVSTITVGALATISPLSGVAQNFTSPVTYTVTAENGSTQAYVVTVAVAAPLSSKAITGFTFASPSATGVVTEGSHTVAITVPNGTAVTALVPTLTISALASVSPLSGVAQNFTSPVTYTVTAENGTTQAYVVTVTVAAPLSSAKAITAFNFASPAETGVVTEGTHTISVSVTNGTVVTALVPTISISAAATVSPLSGVAQDFTSPVTYTVTAENGSTQAYVVTVTVRSAIGSTTTYTGTGTQPQSIAFDGTNMWTANYSGYSVTKVTPSGVMTTYTGTGTGTGPSGIAFDGTNMWTANFNAVTGLNYAVTKVTPSGTMTTYTGTGYNPQAIAFDGTNMWTANSAGGSNSGVTKVTPSGSMTTYGIASANPYGIAFDGTNMWTVNGNNSVTKIPSAGSPMTTYTGIGAPAYGIAYNSVTGDMWTASVNGNSVTRITPSGTITTYTGTGADIYGPYGIAFNSVTGDMWTANNYGNSVSKITPAGSIQTFSLPASSGPRAIAFDGTNMWTANASPNSVTKIVAR